MSTDTEDLDIAAFPNAVPEQWSMCQDGMSLRDWFAGQALAGMLHSITPGVIYTRPAQAAENAYALAQAMLVERQKYEAQ